MSDHWIALIPEDPWFVPDEAKQRQARDRLALIAPNANDIGITVSEKVQFNDCGENFEHICCPSCESEITVSWWQDRMDEDYENGDGFILATYVMPCCGVKLTLHELKYEWSQGFGRFKLDAMNPDIGLLNDQHKIELEEILGTKLRVIYQHL